MEAPHGPKRFSVAEDADLIRKLTREILEVRGYNVIEASDGERRSRFARVTSEPSISALGGRHHAR